MSRNFDGSISNDEPRVSDKNPLPHVCVPAKKVHNHCPEPHRGLYRALKKGVKRYCELITSPQAVSNEFEARIQNHPMWCVVMYKSPQLTYTGIITHGTFLRDVLGNTYEWLENNTFSRTVANQISSRLYEFSVSFLNTNLLVER